MAEVRCWLVEREFWDEDLVTLVYATPDGARKVTRQFSTTLLTKSPTTAAITVDEADLEPTPDGDRERYAREADRMAEQYAPDETV